jgi:N6-L-threonylcarbamoyladenine synthase
MVLAIESSCDETSAAVVQNGRLLSNIVASQVLLHSEYGGVVPELATREHLRNLIPVVRKALETAGISMADLTAVAATRGPGLPAALMAGWTAAQSLATARGLPVIGIHHHEAHLYSPWISGKPAQFHSTPIPPHVSLIASGGHTLLVHVRAELDQVILGGTLDDAAGECFDKAAKLLGLPYPGGPVLDRLAEEGRADRFEFPRPLRHEPNHHFSFSGLKTSVRVFLEKNPGLADSPQDLRDLCAGIRAAIVDTLTTKLIAAATKIGVRCITASGGVACNRGLRRDLQQAAQKRHLELRIAEPAFCTDNAAMIGFLAERRLARGQSTSLDTETGPGWELENQENHTPQLAAATDSSACLPSS